ncbi:hypothetical protein EV356DRAFT_506088 [Viridothelium virens]|uniref:Wax synthase domain-containing protein n=1 Tax=Viridothelium virens TaxID=1048519 RepID=A0A6A6HL70_VIRVR|nr:hypothetical protein EV356DRAFT_506088 [Viridothelium virens]
MAPAFGLGLIKLWSVLWTSIMILVHDCKTDFRRIDRVLYASPEKDPTDNATSTAVQTFDLTESRQRHRGSSTQITRGSNSQPVEKARDHSLLVWQDYPATSLLRRIDWVLDLYTNFRGMSWNWRIAGPPPIPDWVESRLEGHSDSGPPRKGFVAGRDGTRMYSNLHDLLVARAKTFVLGYFVMDILKNFMMHDIYFLHGDRTLPPPSFLPSPIRESYFLVQSYRLLLSMAMMYTALHTVFDLSPLFFAGLLGPTLIGVRGEPWIYPDTYGAFSTILDKGLAGWWGGWWHQTFRFAFEATAKRILQELGFDISSLSGKALQLIIAFSLSGCLHACASVTQLGQTHPITGAFSFFLLQSLGILLQILLSHQLKKIGVVERTPKILRRATNLIFTSAWLYLTAPLICDDFAAGGIWLFEPIPISPLRGLGLGIEGTGWWCWKGFPWIHWYRGQHWWQTGFIM